MSKILVTGAAGFVGKALCQILIKNKYEVIGAVRSVEKRSLLPTEVEICVLGDIGPHMEWAEALNSVDTIVHLASRVHVMHEISPDSLSEYRKVNVSGTEGLANMAAMSGVRRMIFLSTIKVNGERGWFREDDLPAPEDHYAISKWEAEQILYKIAAENGLEIVIIRIPLVYGPGVKANFLRLLNMTNKNIPLPLSLINNKRSMIYIGNLVDAIIRCIEYPDAANQTFLVSDGQDISTPDLIRMIAKAMGKKARLIPFPLPLLKAVGQLFGKSPEIERLTGSLCIDSSKIREVLGWKPPYTMEESIRETVKWYQNSSRSMMC